MQQPVPSRELSTRYVRLSNLAATIATTLAGLALFAAVVSSIPAFGTAIETGTPDPGARSLVESLTAKYDSKAADLDEAKEFLAGKEADVAEARASGDRVQEILEKGPRDQARERVATLQSASDELAAQVSQAKHVAASSGGDAGGAWIAAFGWLLAGLAGASVIAFMALLFRVSAAKAQVLVDIRDSLAESKWDL